MSSSSLYQAAPPKTAQEQGLDQPLQLLLDGLSQHHQVKQVSCTRRLTPTPLSNKTNTNQKQGLDELLQLLLDGFKSKPPPRHVDLPIRHTWENFNNDGNRKLHLPFRRIFPFILGVFCRFGAFSTPHRRQPVARISTYSSNAIQSNFFIVYLFLFEIYRLHARGMMSTPFSAAFNAALDIHLWHEE